MVRADELATVPGILTADAGATVPARVEQCPELAIVPANDDQRIVADIKREIVARSRSLVRESSKQPSAIKDPIDVEPEEVIIGIKRPREAISGTTFGYEVGLHD